MHLVSRSGSDRQNYKFWWSECGPARSKSARGKQEDDAELFRVPQRSKLFSSPLSKNEAEEKKEQEGLEKLLGSERNNTKRAMTCSDDAPRFQSTFDAMAPHISCRSYLDRQQRGDKNNDERPKRNMFFNPPPGVTHSDPPTRTAYSTATI